MYKLIASIRKDLLILRRDRVGLAFILFMPVLLVIIITSLQNSTFEMVNSNKVKILLCNEDEGKSSLQFIETISKLGMFELIFTYDVSDGNELALRMHNEDALLAILIPENFSSDLARNAEMKSEMAFNMTGNGEDAATAVPMSDSLLLYYHPVLQNKYRINILNGLYSALQMVETKQILELVHHSLHEDSTGFTFDEQIFQAGIDITEVPVSRDMGRTIPNASQHNIPAWTIFAMFFIVISLAGNMVKEKLSGSHLRLKTLPTNYMLSLLSRMIVFTGVCMLQVLVIFSIGVFLFPLIGLPQLNLPADLSGLILVSLITAICAVSYAICIGVFAGTQEQANGFGAVSIVILAALGGILVPSFAMSDSFRPFLNISPMHWSLEAYYVLFLEGGKLRDLWGNLVPLLLIILILQMLAYAGLRRQKLI
jgi:ABC-2 type transport system permease protein